MSIRIAINEFDSKSASYIYAMSWKSAYSGIFSDALLSGIPVNFWIDSFNGNFSTKRFNIAILSDDGEDIGAGGYGFSRDYSDKEWGEITSIYFLEKAWGKGYSKELMGFMVENLRNIGCNRIHVWVLDENTRAQHFYEKFGFKKTDKTRTVTFKGEAKIDVEYRL